MLLQCDACRWLSVFLFLLTFLLQCTDLALITVLLLVGAVVVVGGGGGGDSRVGGGGSHGGIGR